MSGTPEARLQRAILLAVGAMPGVLAYRTAAVCCYLPGPGGTMRPVWPLPPGWPDLTLFVAGRVLGVEVKAPRLRRRDGTARLRPSQDAMRAAWLAQGCGWVTATSVEEVVVVVRRMLAGAP